VRSQRHTEFSIYDMIVDVKQWSGVYSRQTSKD